MAATRCHEIGKKKKEKRQSNEDLCWQLVLRIRCPYSLPVGLCLCLHTHTHTHTHTWYKRGHFRGKQAPEDRWEETPCPRCPVPVTVFPQSVTLSICSAPMPRLWAWSKPAGTVCGAQACRLSAQSGLYFCNRCWNRALPAPELTEGPSRQTGIENCWLIGSLNSDY